MRATPHIERLLEQVQGGDDAAAAELYCLLKSPLKRMVRAQLRNTRLRSAFDSWDVLQEIMLDFFRGVKNGAFAITTADDMWKLLTFIQHGVTLELVQRFYRARRDVRRKVELADECDQVCPDPQPDEIAERREFMEVILSRLNPDDRRNFSMLLEGWTWEELAAREGTTAGQLRMRIVRAVRVLGLAHGEGAARPK